MINVVFLIEQIAIGLYILCALGVLLGLRSLMLSRQQLQGAQFELQKELASFRVVNAATAIILSLELALAVLAVSRVVAPTLRNNPPKNVVVVQEAVEAPFVTAVPGSLIVGTPPPNFSEGVEIQGIEDELNLAPFATPTLTPTPVGTIIPDAPAAIGCDTDEARFSIPANGMIVHEAISVVGTANTADFAFYRFELNGPETNNVWAKLAEYTLPVINGNLGQLVPSQLTPGEYKFRLMVFDITSAPKATCTITIFVSAPIPTPTPLQNF
ncbi:MAG: hypothetical protein JXN59_10630 [Anaerolineae bacterium]|nr:hypothetical protein [Anaerolineae bacterium]